MKENEIKDPLQTALEKALRGVPATVEEALELDRIYSTDELCDAADEVRRRWCGDTVDTCSIANARSGRCSEDCKWCAQSARHHTGIAEYDIIPDGEAVDMARSNSERGVRRFSLVTSGRKVAPGDIERFCSIYRHLAENTPIYLCASMGLLTLDELKRLKEAGVRRYHCNLETSSDFFPSLCSTHTHEDKLRTIAWAREAGLEICSGGIIGMGENMRQRLTMVSEAREAGAVSVPVNILSPIKGTALENTPLIGENEIARSVALMRFIAPKVTLRFAGGRARLSEKMTERILRGGMNGSLVGDMLTTIGNSIEDDYALYARIGRQH